MSSPIRGTWIEILMVSVSGELVLTVVPHTGDVDRNTLNYAPISKPHVVPHTGDVDRNARFDPVNLWFAVVPHTGDVDRNSVYR